MFVQAINQSHTSEIFVHLSGKKEDFEERRTI